MCIAVRLCASLPFCIFERKELLCDAIPVLPRGEVNHQFFLQIDDLFVLLIEMAHNFLYRDGREGMLRAIFTAKVS